MYIIILTLEFSLKTTYRHVNLLSRKQSLLLKTEALYFIKVHCSLYKKIYDLDIFVEWLLWESSREGRIGKKWKIILQSQAPQ